MAIKIENNVSLKNYSTMRVGGNARFLTHVKSKEDIEEAARFAKKENLPILAIGDGANILFGDSGFDGLVIVVNIPGFEILENSDDNLVIKVGAGENWDDTVKKTVELGFSGMEAMSLIPGTVGAAPVMNIGAYGQEARAIIEKVTAYDLEKLEFVEISGSDSEFKYRASRFTDEDRGRFIILDVTFRLHRKYMKPPFYRDIEKYFVDNGVKEFTPAAIREAVLYIRKHKLPDPREVGTNGSFFKNPVVTREKWNELISKFPELDVAEPQWPQAPRWFLDDGSVKIAAARLIEMTGLVAAEESGVSLWPTQHLTIVNRGADSAEDILHFKDKIKSAIRDKFGIDLEEEVQIVS